MDISGISTSLNTQGSVPSSAPRNDLQPVTQDKQADEVTREPVRGIRGRRGLALGILKQELRLVLKAQFQLRFVQSAPAYAQLLEPVSPDDVAEEALGAAKQLVAESPTTAAKSVISFRAKVQETAAYVRESVSEQDDDVEDIDDVVAKVDAGLDDIENEIASYRESSASVLAVDTRSKQRSTIQIRTQEGDVVRFSLKRVDSMSASDVAYTDGQMSVNSTEVAVSSRSRMMMKVEGDLNESELAAIQNVFAQAEMIADEFFGGDIGAAFNMAQGFEFDTEQLARVKMRFRMREVSNVAYAESLRTLPGPEAPVVTAPVAEPALRAVPEPVDVQPAIETPVGDTQVAEQAVTADPAAIPDTSSALQDFLDSLSVFLRAVGEGFEGEAGEMSFKYHYSESFKLEMLKAVLHTVAPGEVMHAADNAAAVIDGISESSAGTA